MGNDDSPNSRPIDSRKPSETTDYSKLEPLFEWVNSINLGEIPFNEIMATLRLISLGKDKCQTVFEKIPEGRKESIKNSFTKPNEENKETEVVTISEDGINLLLDEMNKNQHYHINEEILKKIFDKEGIRIVTKKIEGIKIYDLNKIIKCFFLLTGSRNIKSVNEEKDSLNYLNDKVLFLINELGNETLFVENEQICNFRAELVDCCVDYILQVFIEEKNISDKNLKDLSEKKSKIKEWANLNTLNNVKEITIKELTDHFKGDKNCLTFNSIIKGGYKEIYKF